MDNNLLISICLPTYNQPKAFEKAIKRIISQATSRVEIIVRDDSSNNETKKIVDRYSKRFPISYYKGEKEGLDVAIIFLTKKAKGKYIWWFGNEVPASGGIKKVINALEKNSNIDFLYVNSASINGDKSINLGSDSRYFKDKNEVIEEIADLLGFISATILKREHALKGIKKSKDFIGSAWSNLYLVFFVVSKSKHSYFLNDICFFSEPHYPEEKLWYDRFQVFGINFIKVTNEFTDVFNRNSLRIMISKNFRQVYRGILVHRIKGYDSSFGKTSPIKAFSLIKYYWSYLEFWVAFPFLLMPRFILKPLYGLYKFIFPNTKNRLGYN